MGAFASLSERLNHIFSKLTKRGSYKLFVDDFNDLLGRVKALQNFLSHGFFRNVGTEFFCDLNIYVRFQQRYAHFAHGGLYFKLGKPAALCKF
mgnify:CR=1 FL=1